MKNRRRYLATSLIGFLSIGIFAAGYLQAAESDQGTMEGQKAIMEGEKKMTDGYNMVTKGESMMTGDTIPAGKTMVTRGAKMMLEAQKATAAAVEKKGLDTVCSIGLDMCMTGERKITFGLE